MPVLPHAIKLRDLADKVDDNEFMHFTQLLVRLYGRDIILKPLFSQSCAVDLKSMIDILHGIIHHRVRGDTPHGSIATFDSLADVLIGEVASYLDQRSYNNCSLTNRAMYIGCTSPNKLHTLNLLQVEDYSMVHLLSYPNIEHLQLQMHKFGELSRVDGLSLPFTNLRKLTLDNDGHTTANITDFISSHLFVLRIQQIQSLTLINFGSIDENGTSIVNEFDSILFLRLIKSMPKLQSLYLDSSFVDINSENKSLFEGALCSLREYAESESLDFSLFIIKEFAGQLTQLHLDLVDDISLFSKLAFPNLHELKVVVGDVTMLSKIHMHMPNLKKIMCSIFDVRAALHFKSMVRNLFTKYHGLEEIVIDVSFDQMESICNGIEYGLLNSIKANSKIKRALRIELRLSCKTVIDVDNIIVWSNRVMNFLYIKRGFFLGYLVRLMFSDCSLHDVVNDWNDCLTRLLSFYHEAGRFGIWRDSENNGIVITDKNSKINGWQS